MSRRIHDEQEGITGLETAIILIAFVIVASVFAYVVLSAGLYSAQKTKEAVNAGLGSSMSTIELKGNILAQMSDNTVQEIYLSAFLPPEFFNGPRPGAAHNLQAQRTVVKKLQLLQEQSFLDSHELLCVKAGIVTAHLPELFIPALPQELGDGCHM